MEFRIATSIERDLIFDLVQTTIKDIYPRYYLQEIVEMFLSFHNKENIENDIKQNNSYVLEKDGQIVGTGTIQNNHITRVYVLPRYQRQGYGTLIMGKLEKIISKNYNTILIDASLPACNLYYKRGYKTIAHGKWECSNEVWQIYEIMEKKAQKNSDLRLRPYKEQDADVVVSWIKDEESLRKWSADRFGNYPISKDDINSKYMQNNGDCIEEDNFYPLTAFDESGVVGHLILRYTDASKSVIRLGFVIVDNTKRGKGYGKQMILLALKYAFEIFKASKVTLGVFDNNESAYNCYKAAGFKETGEEISCEFFGENWNIIELEVHSDEWF